MPAVRLIAEGVGPFEKLDLDLSDGHGNPHLGPHILAGVNGSGKSTALRAIAWVLDFGSNNFPQEQWRHALAGRSESNAALVWKSHVGSPYVIACTRTPHGANRLLHLHILEKWLVPLLLPDMRRMDDFLDLLRGRQHGDYEMGYGTWSVFAEPESFKGLALRETYVCAAYAPSLSLQYLDRPDLTKTLTYSYEHALGFEGTVNNEAIQAWLLGLFSKSAIAEKRGQVAESYERSLKEFQTALQAIYAEDLQLDVEIDPVLQPRVRIRGQSLNLSQIPDGVRTVLGWLADFMMRRDRAEWDPSLKGKRPGILLLDEVDAHLHPLWQRRLLPAMREALPDVQIIVTTHSPFVINSCPGSRVHVLELDEQGRAHAQPPVDAPVGASVTATLKDIFGVESRFDIRTEKELDEWNEIKRKEASRKLTSGEKRRLQQLTADLSGRSEELRSIVGSPPRLSPSVIRSLTGKGRAVARR